MAGLNVPSIQHLARNWRDSPKAIARDLVRLAENPPTRTYKQMFGAVTDLILFKHPLDEVEEGIRRKEKRKAVCEDLLSILPMVHHHFEGVRPDFVNRVATRYYPIGREIMIPFTPPLFYGVGGRLHFPWFSFWKRNPLQHENLSLFVTVVQDILSDDPDLEELKFEILDFSAPRGSNIRSISVIDASEIPRVSPQRKNEMLQIFADGFILAKETLGARPRAGKDAEKDEDRTAGGLQPDLFL